MHLLHERKLIYYVLALTVVFFIFLMFVPLVDQSPTRFPARPSERRGNAMSLKWFHIVFITLSMLISLGFGVWGLFNQFVVAGRGVAGRLRRALRLRELLSREGAEAGRMRNAVATLVTVAGAAGHPDPALACPVCFGAADSPQTRGVQAGIVALLVVTVVVLARSRGSFSSIFDGGSGCSKSRTEGVIR